MNSFPKYPYIGTVYAKNKSAAIRLFIDYLLGHGYFRARKTVSAYTAEEITKKAAHQLGGHAIGFEREDVKLKERKSRVVLAH
jgi:hypothetical protein